jgi:ectoine hydroxylase-related dioxygenase (phytanoyl-CoA dioxygenase family)
MATNELPRFRRGEGDAVVAALLEVGAAIVEDLVVEADLLALAAELQPHADVADPDMEHVNQHLQTFYRGVRNVTGLVTKSPTFVDAVLLHPLLLAAADAIVGPNCASYTLNLAHLMVREPGAPRQWIHRDQGVWSFLPKPHAEVELSVVVALCDFTEANGATAVVPGSHLWEPDRSPQEHEITYAEMPAGSAALYLGSTLHAGGANGTDQGRPGIHLSYVAGWLRPEENNTLATPPDVARSLPRRARQLVGYGIHDALAVGGGHLGCVDLRDPSEMLIGGDL